jgi:hypothetical protein
MVDVTRRSQGHPYQTDAVSHTEAVVVARKRRMIRLDELVGVRILSPPASYVYANAKCL